MSQTIGSETLLPAAPDAVWAGLLDFGCYPQWNPFVRSIEGTATDGASLCIALAPPLGPTVRICTDAVALQPYKAFA